MMATAGEILRLALHYTQAGAGDMMNVFHFELGGTVGDDAEVAADVEGWAENIWGARWALLACSATTLSHGEYDIINLDGTVARNIGGGIYNVVGTVGGEVLPAGVAAHLTAHTTIPKARGSKYIPGVAEADSVGGQLSVGALADLAILLGFYLTAYTGANGVTITPGILSKVLVEFVPFIASGLIDTLTAYQRRRKVGVGI